MTHIYSIYHIPNTKKIPRNAITHYTFMVNMPAQNITKQTNVTPQHPAHGSRKIIAHADTPKIIAYTDETPVQNAPKQTPHRSKYRNNVDKAALAKYFDNTPTRLDEWRANIIAEFDIRDTMRAAATHAEHESLRQFVESVRNPHPDFQSMCRPDIHYVFIVVVDMDAFEKDMAARQYADAAREAINDNILYKFEQQMQRTNQSRGMKKMHDIHKMRHR